MTGATGNSETTYYNESGTILGYSSTTVGEQPGPDGTPQQSSNTSYKDANREFIGSSFTDSYGTGFNTNETVSISADDIDLDGDGTAEFTISDASYPSSYRVETGGFTPTDTNESGSTNTTHTTLAQQVSTLVVWMSMVLRRLSMALTGTLRARLQIQAS